MLISSAHTYLYILYITTLTLHQVHQPDSLLLHVSLLVHLHILISLVWDESHHNPTNDSLLRDIQRRISRAPFPGLLPSILFLRAACARNLLMDCSLDVLVLGDLMQSETDAQVGDDHGKFLKQSHTEQGRDVWAQHAEVLVVREDTEDRVDESNEEEGQRDRDG